MELDRHVMKGFVQSLLAKKFDAASPIPDFHLDWWDMCCSKEEFIAIAAPRAHSKSTAISFCFVLAAILFRKHTFGIICSGTSSTSVLFLQDIKNEIQDNVEIQNLFGIKRDNEGRVLFAKDTEDDVIIQFEDGYQARLLAKGAEQKLRGIKWGSKRPDLIIGDDLEDDEQVLNKDRREKFRKWFYGALLPCRAMGGKVIIVGTILHLDSLLERLMPSENSKETIKEDLVTYSHKPRRTWKSIKYRAHNKDFSKILWKERYDKAWFQAKFEDYSSQGLSDIYAQEFLNEPLDETNAFFKRTDFVNLTKEDKEKKVTYYVAADLAVSEKQRADYTAIVVGGMDESGILQIRNVIRERMDSSQIVNTLLSLQRIYDPHIMAIEEGAISKAIGPFFREQMIATGTFPNIVGLKPSTDKITRARSIQARCRARAVRFDKDSDWYSTLEEELARFPRDKHDDQVDAMAYLGHIVDKMVTAPTKEEQDEDEYLQEMQDSGLLEEGRNETTGY